MTSVYIEASALFRRYTDEPGADAMDTIVSFMESGKVTGQISLLSIPEILRFVGMPSSIAANMRQILYGGLLVAFMMFRPKGILGQFGFRRD